MSKQIKHLTSRQALKELTLGDIKDEAAFLLDIPGKGNISIRRIGGEHVEIYISRGLNDFVIVTKAKGGGKYGGIKFLARPEDMLMVVGAAIAMSNDMLIPVYV